MFLKIRVRNLMLYVFGQLGLSTNPYSLDPLCNFLYYDYLNDQLPELKKTTKDPARIVRELFASAHQHSSDVDANNILQRLVNESMML